MAKYPGLRPRNGKWYVRVRVPKDVVDIIGKVEISRSLFTSDRRLAESKYFAVRAELDRRFAAARRRPPMLTAGEAKRMVLEHFSKGERAAVEQHYNNFDPVTLEVIHEAEFEFGMASSGAEEEVMAGICQEADGILIENGWPVRHSQDVLGETFKEADIDKSNPAYIALCTYVRRAWVERERRRLARLKGEDLAVSADPMFAGIGGSSRPVERVTVDRPAAAPTLTTIFEKWKAERKPPSKTVHEWGTAVRRFTEVCGDLRVDAITTVCVRDFKDALLDLPVVLKRDLRGKTVPQVLAATKTQDASRLSAGTVNKQLTAVRTLLSWCASNGYVESNVAAKLSVSVPKNKDGGRRPYSAEDMRALMVGLHEYSNSEPSKFWLPLLAAFTGARLEELGQLSASDVCRRDGIDYIDINADGDGKSLKTRSSRREVPLHPELVRCGFLNHVERRRAVGGGFLFPDLKPDQHGVLTGNFSKWWGHHARGRGIDDHRKVFHSFRHGFKQACRAAGIGEEVHDALTGHSGGGVGRSYGSVPLDVTAGEIEKVRYGALDLSHLHVN